MKFSARVQAAITILDQINDGEPGEKILTTWGRQNRYAGSKDRAFIRDLVYSVLRRKRSAAAIGQGNSGRQLLIGYLTQVEISLDEAFDGSAYGPSTLTDNEVPNLQPDVSEMHDLPDWVFELLKADLGEDAHAVAQTLRSRAPIGLRAVSRNGSVEKVQNSLVEAGIDYDRIKDVPNALVVAPNTRGLQNLDAYKNGQFEFQDLGAQRTLADLKVNGPVLDYCAGGGGKALALADQHDARVYAYDVDAKRMADLPIRAKRSNSKIDVLSSADIARIGPFETILCDVPCSGSGTWRRSPEAKWQFTPEKLEKLCELQKQVLRDAIPLLAPGGTLVLITCSIFKAENEALANWIVETYPSLAQVVQSQNLPNAQEDGFFKAIFTLNVKT